MTSLFVEIMECHCDNMQDNLKLVADQLGGALAVNQPALPSFIEEVRSPR